MKRFFSLLTLLVMIVTTGGYVHAQTTYEISTDTRTKATKPNWEFTSNGIVITISNKNGKGSSDGNSSYLAKSLKFAKSTEFTISVPENIKISKVNFKGYTNVDNTDAHLVVNGVEYTDDVFIGRKQSYYKVNDYTYDWGEGSTLTFSSANDVEMCFIITLTEAASDKLNAPTFSYDEVAGKVKIVANGAKEIRYTTDGTEPSATNGSVYTDPFEASNVTVKAIAISDGTKENSDVATYEVPAKLLSTVVDLTKVTIDGTELSADELHTLLTNKTFTSTASYAVTPVIKYTETTTKKYDNETNTSNAEEKTATVVRGENNFTTSFTVGEETYTITLPINKDITPEAPTHVAVNGTVALSCATEGASISYKIGNGEYQEYTRPFTILDEDATVTAKAYIGEKETACEPFTVEAVKCTERVKTLWFYYDTDKFDIAPSDKGVKGVKPTVTGKAGTDCDGYVIEMNKEEKAYQYVSDLTIGGNTYRTIKVSNGAENILKMPEGVKANRITIYSVINEIANNKVSGWKNVNGTQEYKSIPMGAYKGEGTDYDVRVYSLNNATGQISFTNTGDQLGFVIALDIVDETPATTTDITIGTTKMATYCNTSAWVVPAEMEVYTATYVDNKVKLNKVTETVIPANTGVVLYGEPKTYTANLTASAAALTENNSLVGTTEDVVMNNETTYVLVKGSDGKVCFGKLKSGETVKAGKAYLTISDPSAAKQLSIDINGETTGINAVENATEAQNDVYYTLGGQRTVKPLKGLYIHNGKKYMK